MFDHCYSLSACNTYKKGSTAETTLPYILPNGHPDILWKKHLPKQCTNELDNRYMLIWSHAQHKPQIDTKPPYTAQWNKTSSLNATKGKQVWWDYQAPKSGPFKSIHSSYNSRLWGQFSLRLLYSAPQMIIIQGIANLLTICAFACVSIFYKTLYKVMILFMWKTPETYTGSSSQSVSRTTCLFKVLKQAGWLISRMSSTPYGKVQTNDS